MHHPKWGLFYDVHTMPACPDVGANFDAEAFTDRLKACGADYVVFHARCNLGMAYYNTQVGLRHPSLSYDLFGKLAECCRKKGIALTAYINIGISHEEALRHRDWTILTPEGYTYQPDRFDHGFRMMCYNTGYSDHVLSMIREILSGYPIAGLFLDCMHQRPCVGGECIREMKELGMDWRDDRQLRDFSRMSRIRMARRIAETAQAIKPDLLLYFNGVTYEDQQDIGTYLEFECLPTGGWSYESLPLYGRYLRTLGKPLLNMTGRFHRSWGDFGGIRTEASLEYDCLHGLALAMRTTIGDHFHPRGDLNHAVFDLIERIYGRLRKLEPWLDNARGAAEIGLVMPAEGFLREEESIAGTTAVTGSVRIFAELKQQFDVLSYHHSWQGYRLLVLPDLLLLDERAIAKLRGHLQQGGAVLASGWSGADMQKERFALQEWGLRLEGEDACEPAYLQAGEKIAEGMPDMPISFYERGVAIGALEGTQVLGEIVAPYYNRHWDGEHAFMYLPPDKNTGRPAVTCRGDIVHVSHPLFTIYANHAPVPMRQLTANLLALLLPNPMVRTAGLPSFARVTVTSQPGRRMVHLLAYVPERRGSIDMIEEPIELHDIAVSLRAVSSRCTRVYLAPTGEELPFTIAEGYIQVKIPKMSGYAMAVFEEKPQR